MKNFVLSKKFLPDLIAIAAFVVLSVAYFSLPFLKEGSLLNTIHWLQSDRDKSNAITWSAITANAPAGSIPCFAVCLLIKCRLLITLLNAGCS